MGYSNWSDAAYSKLSSSRKTASRSTIFRSSNVDPAMNPHGLKFRESRDSAAHPDSNAIIVAFGFLALEILFGKVTFGETPLPIANIKARIPS